MEIPVFLSVKVFLKRFDNGQRIFIFQRYQKNNKISLCLLSLLLLVNKDREKTKFHCSVNLSAVSFDAFLRLRPSYSVDRSTQPFLRKLISCLSIVNQLDVDGYINLSIANFVPRFRLRAVVSFDLYGHQFIVTIP